MNANELNVGDVLYQQIGSNAWFFLIICRKQHDNFTFVLDFYNLLTASYGTTIYTYSDNASNAMIGKTLLISSK
jgi:hypothetical protein